MRAKHAIFSIFAIVLLFTGCKQYDTIRYSRATVFKKKPVKERISEYDIYVHDNSGKTFKVSEAEVSEGILFGNPLVIADSLVSKGDSLNDMHVYMNESETIKEGQQQFNNKNVRYVNMRGKSKSTKTGIAFGILLALLLIPLTLLIAIIIGLSDSGGSGSGGSNSGGSDSGCYIATMSYGSYSAPEVLVLREFRDRFLQKFGTGRTFIAWYYRNSPSFVEKHRNKKWLHKTLRLPLNAFVLILKPFYSGRNAEK